MRLDRSPRAASKPPVDRPSDRRRRAGAHGLATSAPSSRIRTGIAGLAAAVLVVAAIFGAQAFGRSVAATIGAAPNAPLAHAVVVDRQGRTLYVLSPETPHHLLCVSRLCLTTWPPATVSSAHVKLTLGAGVVGPLGVLRRTDGRFQLTLRGRPLYRFSADRAKGQANGNALHSFGGTWHVLAPAGGSVVTPPAATTPALTPTTPAAITPAPAPMTTPTTPITTPAPAPTPPTYPGGYTY